MANEELKPLRIKVPVECQNGHKAEWIIDIRGLHVGTIGVPREGKCDCPKVGMGQGYHAVGNPRIDEAGAVSPDAVTISRELYDFLLGQGPLDGMHFGDHQMRGKYKAQFWWRKHLRAAGEGEG